MLMQLFGFTLILFLIKLSEKALNIKYSASAVGLFSQKSLINKPRIVVVGGRDLKHDG